MDDTQGKVERCCAREFSTYKDPSVFVAVSVVDNTSLIDLLAVMRGHRIMCFDAVAAFGETNETELVYIEANEEHKMVAGAQVL